MTPIHGGIRREWMVSGENKMITEMASIVLSSKSKIRMFIKETEIKEFTCFLHFRSLMQIQTKLLMWSVLRSCWSDFNMRWIMCLEISKDFKILYTLLKVHGWYQLKIFRIICSWFWSEVHKTWTCHSSRGHTNARNVPAKLKTGTDSEFWSSSTETISILILC
jgi:hypothetical protein